MNDLIQNKKFKVVQSLGPIEMETFIIDFPTVDDIVALSAKMSGEFKNLRISGEQTLEDFFPSDLLVNQMLDIYG